MSQKITNCSFNLQPTDKGYKLQIAFLKKNQEVVSYRTVLFKQKEKAAIGETLDIYSQNGVHLESEFLKNLFKSRDEKGMKLSAGKFKTIEPLKEGKRITLITLDIQDGNERYENAGDIQKSESDYVNFLRKKEPPASLSARAKKIQKLFTETFTCDFVLKEGSLKHSILDLFSNDEKKWLQKEPEGKLAFCECAEFYMTFFKLGYTDDKHTIQDYFVPVKSTTEAFEPLAKSTVWYPDSYKDLYAIDSAYSKSVKDVFTLALAPSEQKSKITAITAGIKSCIIP